MMYVPVGPLGVVYIHTDIDRWKRQKGQNRAGREGGGGGVIIVMYGRS